MELFDWNRSEIVSELARPAAWEELDGRALDRLALGALFLTGRGDGEAERLLCSFYPTYARRAAADDRRRVFTRIADAARSGLLRGHVLAAFLRGETDRELACEAAFELVCLDAEGPTGARGADLVLDLVVTGGCLNAGAALGGLLAHADPDTASRLALLRPALALPGGAGTLAQMARCARGCAHVAVLSFWVEWMEQLAVNMPDSRRVLERAADALARQREAMTEPVVYAGRCILPANRGGLRHEEGVRGIPLRDYVGVIGPRLAAIAETAPGLPSVQRALAAWGHRH